MDANGFSRKERKERKGCGAFPKKNFADVANFARGKTIRTLFYTFYMFYTAKSNPRFRVFGVFRGSQSNQEQETRNFINNERNKTMKLTKTQIKEKRAELVNVLLKIEKLKDQKTSIEKILAPDFETNEAAYRNGVVTENGILMRKVKWESKAKPIIEAA